MSAIRMRILTTLSYSQSYKFNNSLDYQYFTKQAKFYKTYRKSTKVTENIADCKKSNFSCFTTKFITLHHKKVNIIYKTSVRYKVMFSNALLIHF